MSESSPSQAGSSQRYLSIDILRGLTILVMIFVNDVAGVKGTPRWMQHYFTEENGVKNWEADGFTFVDVVFPAFLFIVGMAIPFAIGRRLDRGESLPKVWGHIVTRTLGLLLAGVFMVNMHGQLASLIPAIPNATWTDLWTVMAYVFILLAFLDPPREQGRRRRIFILLRLVGFCGLAALAGMYVRPDGARMETAWWGILGLIGWAYLTACIVYTLLRHNPAGMVGVIALLYCLFPADFVQPSLTWLLTGDWVGVGSQIGSHGAITLSGALLGTMLLPGSPLATHLQRIRWAFLFAGGLALAAVLLYRLHTIPGIERVFIINKNIATPPWCLWCSAITIWVWILIYLVTDVMGIRRWSVILHPAGENPLMAYLLHPLLLNLFALCSFTLFDQLGAQFSTGFWRSVVMAFGVTLLAGLLRRRGVHLRL